MKINSDSDQDYVNVDPNDSEPDYINVETDDSDQDYVNADITEHRSTLSNKYEDLWKLFDGKYYWFSIFHKIKDLGPSEWITALNTRKQSINTQTCHKKAEPEFPDKERTKSAVNYSLYPIISVQVWIILRNWREQRLFGHY